MIGWIGDPLSHINPHPFADADFAGCVETMRSTSGDILVLRGPFTSFPIAAYSKRQGCVSHSTPEAEIVSMDNAMRTLGLPSLTLWATLLPHESELFVHEDNSAMIRVVQTGRNPTMRYLHRTHRCSVAWLHEQMTGRDGVTLVYEGTDRMAADIFTKAFTTM